MAILRFAAVALLAPRAVHAGEDPLKDVITVMPSTDALVKLTPEERKLTLEYGHLGARGFTLYARASAPLDENTRVNAFVDSRRTISPFSAQLQLGYDQRSHRLKTLFAVIEALGRSKEEIERIDLAVANGQRAFCDRRLADEEDCTNTTIDPKVARICADEHLDCDSTTGLRQAIKRECPTSAEYRSSDRCFAVAWVAESHKKEVAVDDWRRYSAKPDAAEVLALIRRLDEKLGAEIEATASSRPLAVVVREQIGPIFEALQKAMASRLETAPLLARDSRRYRFGGTTLVLVAAV